MPIRRIVLCRLGGIGDVIHTLQLVKYLRDKYKSVSIEYITSGNVAVLLKDCCPFINQVWVFDKTKKRELGLQILNNLNKMDFFFNLHSSVSFFFFNLLYIKAKKYFQYKKDNLMTIFELPRYLKPAVYALMTYLMLAWGAMMAEKFIYFQF